MLSGPPVIVGRADDAAQLEVLVRFALNHDGRPIVIEGEPGIGKTAILGVVDAACTAANARVLRCLARGTDRHLPFSTLASCPELASAANLTGTGTHRLTETVIDTVIKTIASWCAERPHALVVDDLQWADAASLVLLHQLNLATPRPGFVMCVAVQPTPRAPELEVLLRGMRARHAEFVTLPPLDQAAVRDLASSLAGAPAGPRLLGLLAGAAGNPGYVTDLVTTVKRRGRIAIVADIVGGARTADIVGDPPTADLRLGDLVRRLDFLTDDTRKVLAVAALLGPEVAMAELSAVLDLPTVDAWGPLADAWANGLLIECGERLRFRHDLVRNAIVDDLPPTMAAALRLQIGLALAQRDAPPERVAVYLLAGPRLDWGALEWLEAALPALMVRAPSVATQLLQRAIALDTSGGPRRLRRLLASALLWTGEPGAAATVAGELIPGADPEGRRELRWVRAQGLFNQGQPNEAIEEASRVGEALQGRALMARCRLYLGDMGAAEAVAASDESEALSVAAEVRFAQRRLPEALALAERAIAMTAAQPLRPSQVSPHLLRALCLADLDRRPEADGMLRSFLDEHQTPSAMPPLWHGWVRWVRAIVRFLDGRWDEALAECAAAGRAPDHLGIARPIAGLAGQIGIRRDSVAGHPVASREPPTRPAELLFGAWHSWASALALEARGDREQAFEELTSCWDRGVGALPPKTCDQLAADVVRLRLAGAGGTDGMRAVAAMAGVLDERSSPSARATARLCDGAVRRDADLLRDAAIGYRSAGTPLYEALAWECAALLLADQNQANPAAAALDNALAGFDRLGAAGEHRRALQRLAERGIRPTRAKRVCATTGWDSLTETEVRIAGLIAAGRSNPEIAAEVYLSRRTVQLYVARMLGKLGLRSRVELAREARSRT